MPGKREVEFLRMKLSLFLGQMADSQVKTNAEMLFGFRIDAWRQSRRVASQDLLQLDRLIEQMFGQSIGSRARAKIDRLLRAQFGFDRLGRDSLDIVKDVLKARRISNDAERDVVSEFMADTGNLQVVGTADYVRLGRILDAYGE